MKIVVGLGNPGEKYARNRHNIGFMVLDQIIKTHLVSPHINKKLEAILYFFDKNSLLVKPQTFMNLAGKAVNRVVDYYKVRSEGLLVVHDDVDLEFGTLKHQFGRGAAGHKGVESIIDELGTDQFYRLRIGIGRPSPTSVETEDWVLENFSENPKAVQKLIGQTLEVVINWLKEET